MSEQTDLEVEGPPPGMDDIVSVRFGDIHDLDQRLVASQDALKDAMAQVVELLNALEIELPEDARISPELAITGYILPKIRALMSTQGLVNAAERELVQRANVLDLPTIDLPGGQKAVLAGRRIPKEHLKGL